MKPRILVTGAAGLIGRRVLDLLRPDYEPVALVRSAGGLPAGIEAIVADLAVPDFVSRLPAHMDGVIHLAQSPSFTQFPDGAVDVFAVNVRALSDLLDWARRSGVGNFIHASTGGVYGRGPRPFREEDPVRVDGPLVHYISTKAAAELVASAYAGIFPVTALRFFFVYGDAQKPTMLMPRLVKAVTSGAPISLAGPDGMHLNPIHVDDAAAAVIAALRLTGNSVINVAGSEVLSMRRVVQIMSDVCDVAPVFQHAADKGDDLIADTSRMQARLHCPAVSFRDGIARLARAQGYGLI